MFIYTNKYYSFRNIEKNNSPEINIQEFYDIYKKYIRNIIIHEYEPEIKNIIQKITYKLFEKRKIIRRNNKSKIIGYPVSEVHCKHAIINDIKNKYATDNNINYDYIIVMRPDNEIYKIIDVDNINITDEDVICSEWYVLGKKKVVDLYCDKNFYYNNNIFHTSGTFKCNKIMFKNNNINIYRNDKLINMKTPENSNKFISNESIKYNFFENNKRVFIVKDYSKENIESEFYKNYKQVDENFIEYIKNKYKELL
jgi:hypothetical protein